MNNIKELINVFEWFAVRGLSVKNIADDMYAELIEMGYLASDLKDDNVVADMFLIDFKYECPEEDLLEFLVFQMNFRGAVDSSPLNIEE